MDLLPAFKDSNTVAMCFSLSLGCKWKLEGALDYRIRIFKNFQVRIVIN